MIVNSEGHALFLQHTLAGGVDTALFRINKGGTRGGRKGTKGTKGDERERMQTKGDEGRTKGDEGDEGEGVTKG